MLAQHVTQRTFPLEHPGYCQNSSHSWNPLMRRNREIPPARPTDPSPRARAAARRRGRGHRGVPAGLVASSRRASDLRRRAATPRRLMRVACSTAVMPEINQEDRFCKECAAPIIVKCPHCGAASQAGTKSCDEDSGVAPSLSNSAVSDRGLLFRRGSLSAIHPEL